MRGSKGLKIAQCPLVNTCVCVHARVLMLVCASFNHPLPLVLNLWLLVVPSFLHVAVHVEIHSVNIY